MSTVFPFNKALNFGIIAKGVWRRPLTHVFSLRPTLLPQPKIVPTHSFQTRTIHTSYAQLSQTSECGGLVESVDVDEKLYKGIDIFVKGHEAPVLDSYIEFCSSAAKHLDITVHRVLAPKFIVDRLTLLKSKHIFKKHRVQYEIRTHKKVLQLKRLTGSTADVYLEYIQRNLPAGVAMHVRKWELERIPQHIQDEMKKNLENLTTEDWKRESELMRKIDVDQSLTETSYEEYQTVERYLVGTTS